MTPLVDHVVTALASGSVVGTAALLGAFWRRGADGVSNTTGQGELSVHLMAAQTDRERMLLEWIKLLTEERDSMREESTALRGLAHRTVTAAETIAAHATEQGK